MERLEIIETLKHLSNVLEAEVKGLSETTLRYRPAEGEWSIKEVVGHLRDGAEVWHKRLYMVCTLTDPVLADWDTIAGGREASHQDDDLAASLTTMREWRGRTVLLLSHAVDWTRIGQHVPRDEALGRRSLKQFAEFVINHEEQHLGQIRALKAAQGVSTSS
jgi:uncharacterized damage-inducible protein DinB